LPKYYADVVCFVFFILYGSIKYSVAVMRKNYFHFIADISKIFLINSLYMDICRIFTAEKG